RESLKRAPGNALTLNDTAWLLATSRDAALRNGPEAVALAEHAVQVTRGREPAVMGTLAAAYAEAGEFDKAVFVEHKAAELASQRGDARLAQTLNGRLALLEAKTAIRQR